VVVGLGCSAFAPSSYGSGGVSELLEAVSVPDAAANPVLDLSNTTPKNELGPTVRGTASPTSRKHLFSSIPQQQCVVYCKPDDACFPDDAVWANELGATLSQPETSLYKVPADPNVLERMYKRMCVLNQTAVDASGKPFKDFPDGTFSADLVEYVEYISQPPYTVNSGMHFEDLRSWNFIKGTYVWSVSYGFHGLCMQNFGGEYVNGDASKGWNLPAYTVAPRSIGDVQAALAFADKHNLQVTIRNTGHSYNSANTAKGSLMIWTSHLPRLGPDVHTDWRNTCGTHVKDLGGGFGLDSEDVPQAVLVFGAGQPFRETISKATEEGYYMVTGSTPSVGHGGGWVMGAGLSFSHRHLGYGVDNVVQFKAVLADGSNVTADECTNADLFWALRGGGGGSFALVTEVSYRLWKDVQVHDVSFFTTNIFFGTHCYSFTLMSGMSLNDLLAASDDHDFSECPEFDGTINATNGCVMNKLQHLCGSWGSKQLDLYHNLDARWGAHSGGESLQFRGTREDADATLLLDLKEFFSFPGADTLLGGVPIFSAERDVTTYASWSKYWEKWGIISSKGLLAEKTFKDSQVCPMANSSGQCIADWVKQVTGEPLDAPTLDGQHWADHWPKAGSDTVNPVTRTPMFTCSLVLDLSEEKRSSVMSSALSSMLLGPPGSSIGFPLYFFGGKAANVPVDSTAIGPQMRSSGVSLIFFTTKDCQDAFDNYAKPGALFTGACFNHWGRFVPEGGPREFDRFNWGSNLDRLSSLKATLDPKHRFNAQNTFGYLPDCP